MSQQPSEEWEDMSETQQQQIKARLMAVCNNTESVAAYRARLIRASRTYYPQGERP